ncbi:MAG: hypothetical protein IPH03_12360 [Tetrasphaera sp.]|nr:hypothetical protein [Tetrasphaera sp.]
MQLAHRSLFARGSYAVWSGASPAAASNEATRLRAAARLDQFGIIVRPAYAAPGSGV